MKKAFVIFVGILCAAGLFTIRVSAWEPTEPDPMLELRRWQNFPELADVGVLSMTRDQNGLLWVGTGSDVRVFDGWQWKVMGAAEGYAGGAVGKLLPTKDGVLAATEVGIYRFQTDGVERVFPPKGQVPWFVTSLKKGSDEGLWAGTAWGTLHMKQEGAVLYTTSDIAETVSELAPYVQIEIVPDDFVSPQQWGQGIGVAVIPHWYFHGGVSLPPMVALLAPNGPGAKAGLQVGDQILSVNGLTKTEPEAFTGKPGQTKHLRVQRGNEILELDVVCEDVAGQCRDFWAFDVLEDREGTVWMSRSFQPDLAEVIQYRANANDSAQLWQRIRDKDGLDVGYQQHFFEARDGTLWGASADVYHGVSRLKDGKWQTWSLSNVHGKNWNYSFLETKDGAIWISGHWGFLHVFPITFIGYWASPA